MRLFVLSDPTCTVTPDLLRSLRRAGGEAKTATIKTSGRELTFEGCASWGDLLDRILSLAPDAVLSINRKGTSGDSAVMFFCEVFRIPLLIWYADNPFYLVLREHERELESLVSLVFDSAFAGDLKAWGARETHHLPLGTDPEHFGLPKKGKPADRPIPISFVGSLGVGRIQEILGELAAAMEGGYPALQDEVQRAVEEGGRWLEANPLESPFRFWDEVYARDRPLAAAAAKAWPRSLLAALVDFQASCNRRIEAVRRLLPLGIRVWGDAAWKLFIPPEHFEGGVAWKDLPRVYQRSRIALNVSRFQLVESVTQRHFDAPLCGAAVLTDARPGLERYFAPGEEILVYRDLDEMERLAREAIEAQERTAALAARARERTLAEHTYERRLAGMEKILAGARERLAGVGEASLARAPGLRAKMNDLMPRWLASGEAPLVRRIIDRLAAGNPADADLEAWRAGVALLARDLAGARSAIRAALELEPKNAVARQMQARMRAAAGAGRRA